MRSAYWNGQISAGSKRCLTRSFFHEYCQSHESTGPRRCKSFWCQLRMLPTQSRSSKLCANVAARTRSLLHSAPCDGLGYLCVRACVVWQFASRDCVGCCLSSSRTSSLPLATCLALVAHPPSAHCINLTPPSVLRSRVLSVISAFVLPRRRVACSRIALHWLILLRDCLYFQLVCEVFWNLALLGTPPYPQASWLLNVSIFHPSYCNHSIENCS